MGIDFEDDVSQGPSDNDLARVSHMANELIEAQRVVKDLEQQLKDAQNVVKKLAEEDLPAMMDEVGLQDFTTKDGHRVVVVEGIFANIPKDKAGEAFNWLREHNFGSLIKNVVTASFGKGEDDKAQELFEQLAGEYKQVTHKEDIHWQTLRAFVREQREQGTPVPDELFGVFTRRTASVSD